MSGAPLDRWIDYWGAVCACGHIRSNHESARSDVDDRCARCRCKGFTSRYPLSSIAPAIGSRNDND